MNTMAMTSSRPYMIRAIYEWIVDNDCTPYLLVDAHANGVQVPVEHVNKDGQIVLNVAPSAIRGLLVEDGAVSFNARFGGLPTDIYVPYSGVLGIYAKENGQGMIFEPEPEVNPEPPEPTEPPEDDKPRPSLRVVK
jgi:stringent starvation protein B